MPPVWLSVYDHGLCPQEEGQASSWSGKGELGRTTGILSGTKKDWSPTGAELLLEMVSMRCVVSIRRKVLEEYHQLKFRFAVCPSLVAFLRTERQGSLAAC